MCKATVQSQSTTVDGLVCLFVVVVYRAGVVLKIWVFHGGRRMGEEALIGKILRFLHGELGSLISAGQCNGDLWFDLGWVGVKVQYMGVGNI